MATAQDQHSDLSTPTVGESGVFGSQQLTAQQEQNSCSCSLHHHHQASHFHPHLHPTTTHHHHHHHHPPQLQHRCDSSSALQDSIIHPYGCSGAPSLISATVGGACDCPGDIQSVCHQHQEPTSGRSSRVMSVDENNPSGSEDSGRKCSTRAAHGALLDDNRMCSHVRKECGPGTTNMRPQTPDERKYASRIEVYSDGTDSGVKGADGTTSEDDQRPPLPPRPPRPRTTAAPRLSDTDESLRHRHIVVVWSKSQCHQYSGQIVAQSR
ncbi:hypothetical protein DMENIID0001_161960 [Sergentomyia squamirostris]